MRIVPTKVKSNPKRSDAKKDIMDLLKNARTNRYLHIKKQPKIKPRYGIFGSSAWARVKRNQPPPTTEAMAPSQTVAKPINVRVQARYDDNLDFLLKNNSERRFQRPTESYINLALHKRNADSQNLSQKTQSIAAEADESVIGGSQANGTQNSMFGDNGFQNSPSIIDVTTPVAKDDLRMTPFSEFCGTIDSMDFNVANIYPREAPAPFTTPSDANIFGNPFNGNSNEFNNHTFDMTPVGVNERPFDVSYKDMEIGQNSPESGWSPNPLNVDEYLSESSASMKSNFPPSSYQYSGGGSSRWTPSVHNYSMPMRQQPLSEHVMNGIREKTSEKMLEVIRRLTTCHFPSLCVYSNDRSCTEYSSEYWADDKQTVVDDWPVVSYQTERATTTYGENGASATAYQQVYSNAFFRNNNVTIMQTCTTSRIFRSAQANGYSDFQYDDDDDDDVQY